MYISLYIKYPQIYETEASEILYVEIRKRQLAKLQNSAHLFAYITSSGFSECKCKKERKPYNICFRFGPSRNLSCTKFAAITKGVREVCCEIAHRALSTANIPHWLQEQRGSSVCLFVQNLPENGSVVVYLRIFSRHAKRNMSY